MQCVLLDEIVLLLEHGIFSSCNNSMLGKTFPVLYSIMDIVVPGSSSVGETVSVAIILSIVPSDEMP